MKQYDDPEWPDLGCWLCGRLAEPGCWVFVEEREPNSYSTELEDVSMHEVWLCARCDEKSSRILTAPLGDN